MSSEEGTVYMIRDRGVDGSDEWVSPEPAGDVITDAVIEGTNLDAGDIDDLDAYVDRESLRAVIVDETEDSVTFPVEGHDVTVSSDGAVEVDA